VLDDYTTAPIGEKLRAALGFVRKMTLEPEGLAPEDARAVLAAGVSKQALADAIEVAYLFNIYDRLADAMEWDVPADGSLYWKSAAKRLVTKGYV
jgi:alkylhydroperoxidase family enzyme